MFGNSNVYDFLTKNDRHKIGTIVFPSSRQCEASKWLPSQVNLEIDLKPGLGYDPIGGGGGGHVAYQTTRLDQASSLVPLTSC